MCKAEVFRTLCDMLPAFHITLWITLFWALAVLLDAF